MMMATGSRPENRAGFGSRAACTGTSDNVTPRLSAMRLMMRVVPASSPAL